MRRDRYDLDRYADGELAPRAVERCESRLRGDERSRATVARVRAQGELLRALGERQADEAPLEGLWERLEAQLEAAPPVTLGERLRAYLARMKRPFVLSGIGLAAAASVALLLITLRRGAVVRETPRPATISNLCDVENLEIASGSGTVLTVPDSHGSEATIIWLTAQSDTPGSGESNGSGDLPSSQPESPRPTPGRIKL